MSAIDDVRQQYAALFASLATALRGKLGTQDSFTPLEMPEAIASIPSGQVTAKLSAPLVSLSRVNKNSENGKFANKLAFTINNAKHAECDCDYTITSYYYDYWIYPYFDLSGGTQQISCVAQSNEGLNQSDAVDYTYSFKGATDIEENAIGTINLGSYSTDDIAFEYNAAGNFPLIFDEVTDIYGNIFIKIPKMYRKITAMSNNQITGFRISTSQIDSDYHIYPCFLDEDGNELPYILIGKYCLSDIYVAKSIKASPRGFYIAESRTLCRQRGTGYQQYDWMMHKLFVDLCLCISRNIAFGKIPSMIGLEQMQYPAHIDGIVYGSSSNVITWYVSYKPSKYENAGGTNSISLNVAESIILSHDYVATACTTSSYYSTASSNYFIQSLGYDPSNEFVNYPSSASRSDTYSSKYYCSSVYTRYVSMAIVQSLSGQVARGLFNCCVERWDNANYARLCYRPISGATGYVEE